MLLHLNPQKFLPLCDCLFLFIIKSFLCCKTSGGYAQAKFDSNLLFLMFYQQLKTFNARGVCATLYEQLEIDDQI